MMSFMPGENVGPYRIIEKLGQGGMATVYKAYHASLDRYVAIKVLHPAFKEEPNFLARFQREARIVANLEHTNIVPVYDFSEHQGDPYLVMRYVEGKTLKEYLHGPMSMEEVLAVLRPVCEALSYAHKQNVLHRDIKPSNIILTGDGHVFLADFGLARIAQSGESSLTRDMMVGTPQYISPEQAKGLSDLDARTDIYSLSVVLFEMLTGRVPFSADTPYAVVHDHIFTPLPLPRSINQNIPPEVEQVLLKGLTKERDDRFASVEELLEAIEQAVKRADTVASPPTAEPVPVAVPAEKASFLQRYRWPLLGGAAVLLLLCCLAGAFMLAKGKKVAQQNVTPASSQPTATPLEWATPAPARPTPPPIPAPGEGAPEAHLQRGDELAKSGDVEGALREYERAVQLDPKLVEAYIKAGDLLMYKQERAKDALGWFERGLAANPEQAILHAKAGEALAIMGRWPEAAERFQQAIDLDPGLAEAHAGLAYCFFRMEDADRAREEAEQALRLNPDVPGAHLVSGLLMMKRDDFDGARRELGLVIRSPKSHPWMIKAAERELKMLDEMQGLPGPKPKEPLPEGPSPEPKSQ
jgi:tetratricopeptide (TPR) repeat protein